MKQKVFGNKVLIVDSDLSVVKELKTILADYAVLEAKDCLTALGLLEIVDDISILLVDVTNSATEGFELFKVLKEKDIDIPVLAIASNVADEHINNILENDVVVDFVIQPFKPAIILSRVKNAILLYNQKNNLIDFAIEQVYNNQVNNKMLVHILSQLVEFRNNESSKHVLNINIITRILLKYLVRKTSKYKLSPHDIELIILASSLHDIGKVYIPSSILNKPGKLTPDEFAIMKTHTTLGASVLERMSDFREKELIRFAYEICRWHHEKWDGKGYPDGLTGKEIPISAQVVSVADCYDALTSIRCYKSAYTHREALGMILNGDCGQFNPILMDCLVDAHEEIQIALQNASLKSVSKQEVAEIVKSTLDLY